MVRVIITAPTVAVQAACEIAVQHMSSAHLCYFVYYVR